MDRSTAVPSALEATPEGATPGRRSRLPRWLGIVFPALVAVAAGFAALLSVDRSPMPVAVVLATPVGVGMAAGAVVRWSMPGRSLLVRWSVAMAAMTVALLTVGLLTEGAAGVLPRRGAGVQWADLVELSAGGLMAAMALVAWRRPQRAVEPPRAAPPVLPVPAPIEPSAVGQWGRLRSSLRRGWNGLRQRLEQQPRPKLVTARPSPPAHRRRGRSDIHLTGAEEHRCPYCLSPVTSADPRGVVICPVCHTPHHADCWAITGTCQIPHAYGSPS